MEVYRLLSQCTHYPTPPDYVVKTGGWSLLSPIPTCLWNAGVYLQYPVMSRHDIGTMNVVCDHELGHYGADLQGASVDGDRLCFVDGKNFDSLVPLLQAAFAPKPFSFFRMSYYQAMDTSKTLFLV